jgi:hypothetical protein
VSRSQSALPTTPDAARLHDAFLSILPRIELHGQVYFRGLKCPHRKEDFIADMVALAWKWFVRLVEKGKDPMDFPSALATFAAKAVKAGRRVTGQERSKDVMSPVAKRKHGVKVEPLPSSTRRHFDDFYGTIHGQQLLDAYEERLRDNTMTPPPDAAAFRIDFPDWLKTRTDRDRRIIEDMARDERTLDLSKKHGISPGRVSQLRREFKEDWDRFCGLFEEHPIRN